MDGIVLADMRWRAMATQSNGDIRPEKITTWKQDRLFLERGEDYLESDSPDTGRSITLRGRDNWLTRFISSSRPSIDEQAIREEVQALFARWLRMQNFCVLMGAGASFYVTQMLNAELLVRAAKFLEGRRSKDTLENLKNYAQSSGDSLERIEEFLSKRIEEFLSQLAGLVSLFGAKRLPLDKIPFPDMKLSSNNDRTNKAIEDIDLLKELLSDLERAIAVACNVRLPDSALSSGAETTVTPHENFLSKLMARDPQHGRAKIFTTNYDTLLEQAMDRLGILYCDGFTGTVERKFNPASYDLDYYYPGEIGEGRVRRYHKVIQLYKLHGSINWRKETEPKASNPYGVRYDSKPLPYPPDQQASQETKAPFRLDEVFAPGEGLAILPTMAKYGQTLAMPFAHLFRAFSHALQQPQTVLFVIGYGGGDEHINQIIHDALVNPDFCLVIVGPKPSEWSRRLCKADYCGRVYFVGGDWGRFEVFAEHLLPDLEALKTDIDVAKTLRELRSTGRSLPACEAGSDESDSGRTAHA